MQVGDPKKTAILAVVALGAIGFCLSQVFGGKDEPRMLRQAGGPQTSAPAGSSAIAVAQLDRLRVDPFSHPMLAAKMTSKQPDNTESPRGAPPVLGRPGISPGEGPPEPFGPGTGIDKTMDPKWPIPLSPGQRPDGATIQVEKLTQITLKAIVKVGSRTAYLSVDGQDARGFRPGDFVRGDVQVAFINDDSVIVKSRKATVTLRVGQQGEL